MLRFVTWFGDVDDSIYLCVFVCVTMDLVSHCVYACVNNTVFIDVSEMTCLVACL